MSEFTNLDQALCAAAVAANYPLDSVITVDVDTREITIPEGEKLFGVEDDEKVEIKHIKLNKRYIDGNIDLSQFQFRISYENANGDRNYDIATNLSVSESAIEFDWLLGRSATLYNGTTSFIVCAVTVNGSTGKVTNEWNSAIGKGDVKRGIKATVESIGGKDLVAQLQTLISTATWLSNNAIEASSRAENSANSAAQSSAAADSTANSIKDSMAQISENKEAVSQLKDDLSANSVADAETRRKLDYLWKLNQGISYQFESDDSVAYSKTVPSGAKLASVKTIGGTSVINNEEIINVCVDRLQIRSKFLSLMSDSLMNSFLNNIKTYVQKGFTVLLMVRSNETRFITVDTESVHDENKYALYSGFPYGGITFFADGTIPYDAIYYAIYTPEEKTLVKSDGTTETFNTQGVVTGITLDEISIPQSIRNLDSYGVGNGDVYNYVDFENKKFVKRCEIADGEVAELTEPIITDISDILTDDILTNLKIEAGGSLIFKNSIGDECKAGIPSNVEYLISLAEVNQ